jgi:hypothetical protein
VGGFVAPVLELGYVMAAVELGFVLGFYVGALRCAALLRPSYRVGVRVGAIAPVKELGL